MKDLICGRPTEVIIKNLFETNGNVLRAAGLLGISKTTLYHAIDANPELKEALLTAKNHAIRDKRDASEEYFKNKIDNDDGIHGWRSAHYYLTTYDELGQDKQKSLENDRDDKIDILLDKLDDYTEDASTE